MRVCIRGQPLLSSFYLNQDRFLMNPGPLTIFCLLHPALQVSIPGLVSGRSLSNLAFPKNAPFDSMIWQRNCGRSFPLPALHLWRRGQRTRGRRSLCRISAFVRSKTKEKKIFSLSSCQLTTADPDELFVEHSPLSIVMWCPRILCSHGDLARVGGRGPTTFLNAFNVHRMP